MIALALSLTFPFLTLNVCAAAEPVIDVTTAPLWTACTGWTTTPPVAYAVTQENDALVFTAQGANREMPWIINLDRLGFAGDGRYLLLRYRARGLSTKSGAYFLHGSEGTHGGRAYAMASDLRPDEQWHVLAVDLLTLDLLEVTHELALKVRVDTGASARLEISKLWFANDLPAEAQLARPPARRPDEAAQMEWPKSLPAPCPGWTTTPATDFSATSGGPEMTFTVRGPNTGMRWLTALPEPVDLGRTPYVAVRYKASGAIGTSAYAIWLGSDKQGGGADESSVIALHAAELKKDGAWHTALLKPGKAFTATQLAVGLDSTGEQASLTLDTVRFCSRPPRYALSQLFAHAKRAAPWPAGSEPLTITGGSASPFLAQRLGLSDWFTEPQIEVEGIPFTVVTDPAQVAQTSTAGFDALSVKLPSGGVSEVCMLAAAVTPPTEPWGIDWQKPRPIELLDVPEKVYFEIRYENGPPDRVLPLDVSGGQWGMRRGLSVTAVHPDPARKAIELVLCDRMQTASFAIVGATATLGAPRVAEPNWEKLSYPLPPAKALAQARAAAGVPATAIRCGVLHAELEAGAGVPRTRLSIAGLEGALTCEAAPVFEVTLGGRSLPAQDWLLEKTEAFASGKRLTLRNPKAKLAATVECVPGAADELLLRMTLANVSDQPVTATLRFPVLGGVRLSHAVDTWYLSGKRGGIINSADAVFSDPLGERHPLQMDGFFNPRTGLALALLTHDTAAQHHFIHLSKSRQGGAWSIEYPDRDLLPGQVFTATEASLVLREGDWRSIFAAYNEWLKTWFKLAAPRLPWFERIFATSNGNAHYDAIPEPLARGEVQPLVDAMVKYIGICDCVHLFGWGSSKQFGDWGDYSHYDEVGGLEYFRSNIRRVQEQGQAVSLYLDGYLNSEKGQLAGAHAQAWAMKRRDGSPQFVPQYKSYNQCPYIEGWRKHLCDTYARVQRDLGTKIMYIDEIGSTDGRWTCWAKDHGHNAREIPYAGEVALLRDIRKAVGPAVALYTEYAPAEVSRQYIDGSISYQALWSVDQEPLAPHFIDLPRFAFPDFKQFHIIYYVGTRAGNWWLLKYPFFNGEVYRNGAPNLPGMDAPSLAFLKRAIEVQASHREAFASSDVQPLVPTEAAGVFANRFSTSGTNVWTLYNANGRNVRKPVLRVKHVPQSAYRDAWSGCDLTPEIKDGFAELAVKLEPKGIGCVSQTLP